MQLLRCHPCQSREAQRQPGPKWVSLPDIRIRQLKGALLLSGDKKREEGSYERNGGISGQNNFAIIKISSVEVLSLLFIWMERGQTCETPTITSLSGRRVGSVSFQLGFITALSKIQETLISFVLLRVAALPGFFSLHELPW